VYSVTLIPTPGHTPGHVSVEITSGDRCALITGDAIPTTAQCGHLEWHFTFDSDAEMAVTSRRKLSETGCIVLGNHFALPSIGRVKADNDAFRWED
jgi:glyoxylase-like metal-dependent hydrolase (beta-lactamase superfamily II)